MRAAGCDVIADGLLVRAAKRLPDSHREILLEDWRGNLERQSGIDKLRWAIPLALWGARRIASETLEPNQRARIRRGRLESFAVLVLISTTFLSVFPSMQLAFYFVLRWQWNNIIGGAVSIGLPVVVFVVLGKLSEWILEWIFPSMFTVPWRSRSEPGPMFERVSSRADL
jgi:hypothetical protein